MCHGEANKYHDYTMPGQLAGGGKLRLPAPGSIEFQLPEMLRFETAPLPG
jgi:hypothetical protein